MKNKRIVLFIAGILFMSNLTGCFTNPKKEIMNYFNVFTELFGEEDLTVIYDKKQTENTISMSSYLDTKDKNGSKTVGVVLNFRGSSKAIRGSFIMRKENEEEQAYPIYYDKDGIHLEDEKANSCVKEEFDNFKLIYDFISLDKEYLDKLKETSYSHDPDVLEFPSYEIKYKLDSDDKNLKKINELYPDLKVDEDNIELELTGMEVPDMGEAEYNLKIYLDKQKYNYFSAKLNID